MDDDAKSSEPGDDPSAKPDMAELMLRLAQIRQSTPESDDTGRRLLKHALALALFMLVLILIPVLFNGSCNPPR